MQTQWINPWLLGWPYSPHYPASFSTWPYTFLADTGRYWNVGGGVLGIRWGAGQGRRLSPQWFGRQVRPRDKPLFEVSPFSLVLPVSKALEVPHCCVSLAAQRQSHFVGWGIVFPPLRPQPQRWIGDKAFVSSLRWGPQTLMNGSRGNRFVGFFRWIYTP